MVQQDIQNQSAPINYEKAKIASGILRAVNQGLRKSIMKLLLEKKRMNVTDIYIKLRMEQSVASQQLAILREGNFVITEREGKMIFYSLNVKKIARVSDLIEKFVAGSADNEV